MFAHCNCMHKRSYFHRANRDKNMLRISYYRGLSTNDAKGDMVTAKLCICVHLLKGCQHIKRKSREAQ